jgi:antiviral helicase SKI2
VVWLCGTATVGWAAQIMVTSKCHSCPRKPASYALAGRRAHLEAEMKSIQKKMSNETLILFDDFTQRLVVLRQLAYISEDNAVALKGRVAAEISTTEELILTELLFEGVLGDLTPPEAVALLSALVFQVRRHAPPAACRWHACGCLCVCCWPVWSV